VIIAKVQEVSGLLTNGGGTTKTVTIAAPAAGNALRLWVGSVTGATISSVSGGGVTWSLVNASVDTSGARLELWAGENSSGSGTTISVVMSTSYQGTCPYNLTEWSGMPTTAVVDGGPTTAAPTTAAIGTASITPSAGNPVLIFAGAQVYTQSVTAGPTGGFTALSTASNVTMAFAYQIVPAASGSYAAGWTKSASYGQCTTLIVGWDGATGGGGGGSVKRVGFDGGFNSGFAAGVAA
jgi:hypothetical protein